MDTEKQRQQRRDDGGTTWVFVFSGNLANTVYSNMHILVFSWFKNGSSYNVWTSQVELDTVAS